MNLQSKKIIKKLTTFFVTLIIMFVWLFSGYPNISINIGTHSLQFPSKIQPVFAVITASSTIYSDVGTFTYIVSTNACEQVIDAWGAGGGGSIGNQGGTGGGGGAFASSTLTEAEDSSHTIVIPAGGAEDDKVSEDINNATFDTTTVVATGGEGENGNNGPTIGGTTGGSTGTTLRAGGAGGDGDTGGDVGGGGGGAGGPEAAGEDGADATSGNPTKGGDGNGAGGNGGAGGAPGSPGIAGLPDTAFGGGGGGGAGTSNSGGQGGAPGGGGGSSEDGGGTDQKGGDGQITITEYIDSSGCAGPPPASLIQHAYKWFANADSVDVGGSSGLNQPTVAPVQGTPFRLRLLLYNEGETTISTTGTTSDLQVATRDADNLCDGDETYSEVVSGSGDIRYYTGNSPADGTAITINVFDPVATSSSVTVRGEDYEDSNTFTNTANAIAENEAGMWDFALYDFSAPPNTTYCFRAMQDSSGSNFVLTGGYDVYPEITTAKPVTVRLRGAIRLRTVRLR